VSAADQRSYGAAPRRGHVPHHRISMINSSAKSLEEMSTVILQFLKHG
jgi:regulator of PEP synthase PpsR (kinase-PPPase family)